MSWLWSRTTAAEDQGRLSSLLGEPSMTITRSKSFSFVKIFELEYIQMEIRRVDVGQKIVREVCTDVLKRVSR